jgi:hypothetical protein
MTGSEGVTREQLRHAAARLRGEWQHKKDTTWDSAEAEVLRDRIDEIDAFISGLDGVLPRRWRSELEAELVQAQREQDPQWSDHTRLSSKFGGGQP